jgi:hypothetical protein
MVGNLPKKESVGVEPEEFDAEVKQDQKGFVTAYDEKPQDA